MVTEEQLNELGKNFPTSSWAIWSETFNKSGPEEKPETLKEFIFSNRSILKNNIILMGLNRSRKDKDNKIFGNFHEIGDSGYDGFLKETIMPLSNIEGAYMTDLSESIGSDSEKVNITDRDMERVIKQLKILKSKKFTVIVFGNRAFNSICEKLAANPKENSYEIPFTYIDTDNKTVEKKKDIKEITATIGGMSVTFFRVRHYSYEKELEKYPECEEFFKAWFKAQLEYLNDKVLNG